MDTRTAINELLQNINEMPLTAEDSIEDIQVAILANNELNTSIREILSNGYNFNKLIVNLQPNSNGYINIPESYLSVDPTDDTDYVVKDHKLFNKKDLTFIFDSAVECEVIENIPFDDIPFSISNYIVKLAGLRLYTNVIGDSSGINSRKELLDKARLEAIRYHARIKDANVLSNTFSTTLLDRTGL